MIKKYYSPVLNERNQIMNHKYVFCKQPKSLGAGYDTLPTCKIWMVAQFEVKVDFMDSWHFTIGQQVSIILHWNVFEVVQM